MTMRSILTAKAGWGHSVRVVVSELNHGEQRAENRSLRYNPALGQRL
jgi:hypothetical protein